MFGAGGTLSLERKPQEGRDFYLSLLLSSMCLEQSSAASRCSANTCLAGALGRLDGRLGSYRLSEGVVGRKQAGPRTADPLVSLLQSFTPGQLRSNSPASIPPFARDGTLVLC